MSRRIILTLCCALLLAACAPDAPEPTATPEPTVTHTPTETETATLARPTRRATLPPEPTATPSLTPSVTNTHVTATFIPTSTKIPTSTPSFTPSLTATQTLTPSATPTISFTPVSGAGAAQMTPFVDRPFAAHFRERIIGLSVSFLDTSHGHPVSWAWKFGDGTTSPWRSPNHRYAAAGRYVVTLTVQDADGNTSTSIRAITVEAESCVVTTGRQVPIRVRPDRDAQPTYIMTPGQQWTAVEAVLDSTGAQWYRLQTGGWLLSGMVRPVSGICPTPPAEDE